MRMKDVLGEVDKKYEHLVDFYTAFFIETTKDAAREPKYRMILKYWLRYMGLMDIYSDTNRKHFYKEAQKVRKQFYSYIPEANRKTKTEERKQIESILFHEKNIRRQLVEEHRFSDTEVKEHLLIKSKDALIFGRVLSTFVRDDKLPELIYLHVLQDDIIDDLTDYEEDLKGNSPNIVALYFTNRIDRKSLPKTYDEAIIKAKKLSIARKILELSENFEGEAIRLGIKKYPTLYEGIESKCQTIRNILS